MKDGEESGWNCGTQISFKIGCIHYSYYWSYVFDQVDHPYVRAKKHMEFIRLVATKKMIPVMVLRGVDSCATSGYWCGGCRVWWKWKRRLNQKNQDVNFAQSDSKGERGGGLSMQGGSCTMVGVELFVGTVDVSRIAKGRWRRGVARKERTRNLMGEIRMKVRRNILVNDRSHIWTSSIKLVNNMGWSTRKKWRRCFEEKLGKIRLYPS